MSTPVGGFGGAGPSQAPKPPLQTIRTSGVSTAEAPDGDVGMALRTALRRTLLAVSVLTDLDLRPTDDGAAILGVPDIEVSYRDVELAIGDAEPETPNAYRRLHRWLGIRRAIADRSLDELAESIRPVALPVDHELHTGPSWVRQSILGGYLDVGVGFLGLVSDQPDLVVVTPSSVLDAAGIDPTPCWPGAWDYLENMGALATARWRRDPLLPVRPMGDCDVVTLLASAVFRGALCADVGGMRAIAVPMRNRGWLELSRVDPAFAQAAASIVDDESRGFRRPVLLTVDEVVMVGGGGRPAEIVLRDSAIDQPRWLRDVLYH